MSQFRHALDAFLAGHTDLAALERQLRLELTQEPQLAAAAERLLEEQYRDGHITEPAYHTLSGVVRATSASVTSPPEALPVASEASATASPQQPEASDGLTVLSPRSAVTGEASATASPQQPDVSDGLTVLSPRSAVTGEASATASPQQPEVSDGLTVLSPRPAVTGEASAASHHQPEVNDGRTVLSPRGRNEGALPPAGDSIVNDGLTVLSSSSATGSTGSTGSTGTTGGIAGWAGSGASQPQTGDVIKERFVLEDIIGKGGMGIVFRARDLRKEEAQDRHPHVALKVLNEDFKRHPESLKALQREARKAQNLAHPNIVTVYDFDRDGANVYMVMELLEGEPLDRYIRRHDTGLPFDQALPIIAALCRALGYAHQHNVVHSDFKPGNAFVTRSGAIKVFDFGIARAAKHQGEEVSGDQTLFDAGSLGALTPAYASCEMLDGLEPDPRDDVYALGCVAYELLSGSHPFKGKSAARAREERLKPSPVRGLTRRQMQALRQALAFERGQRSAGALEFLTALTPPPRSPGRWIAAGSVVVVAVAAGVVLVPSYLERRDAQAIAALVSAGTAQSIQQALPKIEALDGNARARLMLDEAVRNPLIADFDARIQALTDASQQRYDYPQAEALVTQLAALLPDSQAVAQLRDALATRRNEQIRQLGDQLDEALEQGWLIPAQHADSVSQVLQVLAQIDPEHPSLRDPRLPAAYADQIGLALRQDDIALAGQLSEAALAVVPGDSALVDLAGTVHWEQVASRQAAQLTQLREQLRTGGIATLDLQGIDALHPQLALLHFTAADDAQLQQVQRRLQTLLDERIDEHLAADQPQPAQALLARYADLLSPAALETRRARIQLDTSPAESSALRAPASNLQSQLTTLLAAPADLDREVQISAVLARMAAYLSPAETVLVEARQQAAASHLQAGQQAREQGRLDEALRSLVAAEFYAPGWARVTEEQRLLEQVREQQAKQRQQERQAAQVAALRQKLLDQVRANDVQGAQASLTELRTLLPTDDVFVTQTAPQALSSALLRVAATASQQGNVAEALARTEQALALGGANPQVLALRDGYAQQVAANTAVAQAPVAVATPQRAPASESEAVAATEATSPTVQPAAESAAPAAPPAPARQQARTGACSAALAGHGSRSRGVCFDELPSGRGPELVVIPAGGGASAPFAMSRFEISNADYAQYCQLSSQCQAPAAEAELPLTGVGVDAVERYLSWLSTTTGAAYRLPTDQEWQHAAGAPGSAERDFNCVVELNGQQIRGFSLTSVRAGRPNGWGLYNLVGNAQEWVRAGGGLSMRGGAFNDPISQCSAQLARPSSGAAAANTGFRVLREL